MLKTDDPELDAFRPRIKNWARAVRNRIRRGTSPTYEVMHILQMQAGNDAPAPVIEGCPRIDNADAQLLDQCALRLSPDRLNVLRREYLDVRTTLDYENVGDAKRAEYRRARLCGLRSANEWRIFLRDAERALMIRVHSVESCMESANDESLTGGQD
jgi:hypothetical protein